MVKKTRAVLLRTPCERDTSRKADLPIPEKRKNAGRAGPGVNAAIVKLSHFLQFVTTNAAAADGRQS